MLQLQKGLPAAIAVPIGGGAVAMVRPATAFEVDLSIARAAKLLAGLIESREAAALAVAVLGDEFVQPDFATKEWLDAAAQRIALLELAVSCVESWSGVVYGDGAAVEKPTREALALVLRGHEAAIRIRSAIQSNVNLEISEGNGFPASPRGEAGTAEPNVPTADASASPARAG